MTKHELIQIVFAALAGALAKEIISWLLGRAKVATPKVKAKIVPFLQKYLSLIDGILGLGVAFYIGYLAFFVSGLNPMRPHQMFGVAFLMCIAFFELKLGVEKIAEWMFRRK
jgi:hypothetical protein